MPYNSGRDHGTTHETSWCNVDESITALTKLKLGYIVHWNIISNVETSSHENVNNDDEEESFRSKTKDGDKNTTIYFVWSTYMDLEDDSKSEP